MVRAPAEQREVAHVEDESVIALERGAEVVEQRDRNVGEGAADIAREVLV